MLTKGHLPKCLNSNALKWIAIVSMFIDHGAVALIEDRILSSPSGLTAVETLAMWNKVDHLMRYIGRLAFPIFGYLIVEGFFHTSDVGKYSRRLLIFACISEIPFDLFLYHRWFASQYQNVFFTLFLGLLAVKAVHRFEAEKKPWKQALAFVACCSLAEILKVDYGSFGVFFIVLVYWYWDNTRMQTILGALVLAWEVTAPLAFIPIRMYNGKRGNTKWKWFFYVFYPAHLLLLAAVRTVLG